MADTQFIRVMINNGVQMRRLVVIFVIFLSSILTFAQQWHTTVSVFCPAADSIIQNMQDVLVVNNSVAQPDGLGHNTYIESKAQPSVDIDLSNAAMTLLVPITQTLDYSENFRTVGLLPASQNTSSTFFVRQYLSAQQARTLLSEYASDGLLVLDQVIVYDRCNSYQTVEGDYYAYLEVTETSVWSVYDSTGQRRQLTYADTLLWEAYAESMDKALEQLPVRKQAIEDMLAELGEKFAQLPRTA